MNHSLENPKLFTLLKHLANLKQVLNKKYVFTPTNKFIVYIRAKSSKVFT